MIPHGCRPLSGSVGLGLQLAIRLDGRTVVAPQLVAAIDQQPPGPLRSHVAQRDRRASVSLSPSERLVVVGITAAHQAPFLTAARISHRRRRGPLRNRERKLDRLLRGALPEFLGKN